MQNTKTLMEQKQLIKTMNSLPKILAEPMLLKYFKKQTKILNQIPKHGQEKQITQLQKPITKQIFFENKTTYDHLEELKTTKILTQKQTEFIKWYQTTYPQLSLIKIMQTK